MTKKETIKFITQIIIGNPDCTGNDVLHGISTLNMKH